MTGWCRGLRQLRYCGACKGGGGGTEGAAAVCTTRNAKLIEAEIKIVDHVIYARRVRLSLIVDNLNSLLTQRSPLARSSCLCHRLHHAPHRQHHRRPPHQLARAMFNRRPCNCRTPSLLPVPQAPTHHRFLHVLRTVSDDAHGPPLQVPNPIYHCIHPSPNVRAQHSPHLSLPNLTESFAVYVPPCRPFATPIATSIRTGGC